MFIWTYAEYGIIQGGISIISVLGQGREFDPGPIPYLVEIDHEIISTVILLPSADSFKKGCCQLQAKVCARISG